MSGYIWAATRLSKDFHYTIGSTVSGHDSKSSINLYFFFCPAQSSKRWLLFETWLPFLQDQWKGLPRLLSYSLVVSFLCSFSTSPPSELPLFCLSLTVKGWSLWVDFFFFFLFLTDRNNPLSWTDSRLHKMKLHAREMTLIFIQANRNFTSGHHAHTHTRTHARPCITLHLYARKTSKWTLYLTMSVRWKNYSYIQFDRKTDR